MLRAGASKVLLKRVEFVMKEKLLLTFSSPSNP
jgi:hypothetical protein